MRQVFSSFLPFSRSSASSRRDKRLQKQKYPGVGGKFPGRQSYLYAPGQPVWMRRDYQRFAEEAYVRNVIVHRSVGLIAAGVSSVGWKLYDRGAQAFHNGCHPLLKMLRHPNPCDNGAAFMERLVCYRLISGNSYLLAVRPGDGPPAELFLLRPDRMSIIAGRDGLPVCYRYQAGEKHKDYRVDPVTGHCPVLHLRTFHPLDDWYGLSPVEAAAYSIDQHNQSAMWNQALLQNGARPSGALVVQKEKEGGAGELSEEQFRRLKAQVDEQFSGSLQAGRPMLLEGGLEWREMSLRPKDMDFVEMKHSAARDIALAFGVPPQLLGIPGDNTYSNLAEARLALWEQTILPLLDNIADALNRWLVPSFGELKLSYDPDTISALQPRREAAWKRVNQSDFLSDEEKRALVGIQEQ